MLSYSETSEHFWSMYVTLGFKGASRPKSPLVMLVFVVDYEPIPLNLELATWPSFFFRQNRGEITSKDNDWELKMTLPLQIEILKNCRLDVFPLFTHPSPFGFSVFLFWFLLQFLAGLCCWSVQNLPKIGLSKPKYNPILKVSAKDTYLDSQARVTYNSTAHLLSLNQYVYTSFMKI